MIENSPTNIPSLNQDDFITKKPPKFILIKIFSYLSINDLGKVAQTCKKLKAISEIDVLWKNIIPGAGINTKKECEQIRKSPFKVEEKIILYQSKEFKEIKLSYFGAKKFGIIGAQYLIEDENTKRFFQTNLFNIKNKSNFLHFKTYEAEKIKEKFEVIFYNFINISDFDPSEQKIILKYSSENKHLALKKEDGLYFPPYKTLDKTAATETEKRDDSLTIQKKRKIEKINN